MNKYPRFIAGVTLIFPLMFVTLLFAQERLSSIVKQVQPSVVTITIHDEAGKATGFGSGFFVSEGGQIVTNRHVIVGAFSAEIKTAEGKVYSITKVVAENKEGDLVRLAVDFGRETVKPLRLSRNLPEAGERVLVIGSPLGLEQTVSEGIVSAVRDSGRLIQITAPISPGSSGSPVVNMKGEVIGVATLQFTEGQNLNFAVSAQRLSEMQPGEGKDLAF
jgi:S1-C subfamily serine protease